jgi:hypothetical protein
MVKIAINRVEGSLGGIDAGLMATQLLALRAKSDAVLYDAGANLFDTGSNITRYNCSVQPTFGSYSTLMGQSAIWTTGSNTELSVFYAALLSKQERLGPEFEQILFDNLWDLYAR